MGQGHGKPVFYLHVKTEVRGKSADTEAKISSGSINEMRAELLTSVMTSSCNTYRATVFLFRLKIGHAQ